jgi:hypothetical protein
VAGSVTYLSGGGTPSQEQAMQNDAKHWPGRCSGRSGATRAHGAIPYRGQPRNFSIAIERNRGDPTPHGGTGMPEPLAIRRRRRGRCRRGEESTIRPRGQPTQRPREIALDGQLSEHLRKVMFS